MQSKSWNLTPKAKQVKLPPGSSSDDTHPGNPAVCLVSASYYVWLFYDPKDCSLPGSSVHGIFQARIVEWVAISFSRGYSHPRDQNHISWTGRQFSLPLSHQGALEPRQHKKYSRSKERSGKVSNSRPPPRSQHPLPERWVTEPSEDPSHPHQCQVDQREVLLLRPAQTSCSVAQSCLTLCSMPGFPVLHHLPELSQTHVHWVSDAIQLCHPLSSPSPPAFNLSQHQGVF